MNRRNREEDARAAMMRTEAARFGEKFGDYNIIAAYPDMRAAKRAIDALEMAGIDASEYSLLGAASAQARSQVDKDADRETDARTTRDVATRAIVWGGAGLIAGAILAAVLAAIPGWPLSIGYSLVIFPIVLGTAGAFIAAMSTLESGEAADMVYRPVDGQHVLLGVASEDPNEVQRAENALNRAHPLTLHRYDRRGPVQA
jgi:hypothetical protein